MPQPPFQDRTEFCDPAAKFIPSPSTKPGTSLLRDPRSHRPGFAAIISVVLVSGIALISSTALAANYVLETRETINRAYAVQARSSAYSCANIAMLRIKKNRSYTGNENISVDKVVCTIAPVVQGGEGANSRTVYAQATVNNYTSSIKVEVADIDQLYVSSWTEIPPT